MQWSDGEEQQVGIGQKGSGHSFL